MVRGRKKKSPNSKNTTGSITATSNTTTPVQTKSRKQFRGKLSHSATVTPANKITKYYSVSVSPKSHKNSSVVPTKLNIVPDVQDNPLDLAGKKNILQENNKISESNQSNLCVPSENGINKTESCVPFSPSTALSQLDLNVNKKVSRVRKRLPIDDATEIGVLKSINEQSENSVLKNNSENKLKIDSNASNFHKNQTKLTEFYPVRRSVRKTGKIVLEEKRKTLEKAILSNTEDGLEMRIFEGKGRGVVAAKKFEKGEFVVEYAGELITIEEAKKREGIYSQDENTGCYMYYFKHKNNQYCVDATQESNRFGRLLNHSRNGNLCTKTIEIEGVPHLILVAKEDIRPGCELTYDYGDRSKLSLQNHPWLAQ